MDEQWLPIPFHGFPDYQVSNLGRVRSLPRTIRYSNGSIRDLDGKILKPIKIKTGYYHINLWYGRKMKMFSVHRLVALAFIPNTEGLPQLNHMDFNKANNRFDNLEWVTPKQNSDHANDARRQKRPRGDEHGSTRVSDMQVLQIRELRAKGMSHQSLADMFGCSQCHISDIVNLKKRAYVIPK